MQRRLPNRLLISFLALAVVVLATAALAHGHLPGDSKADSNCPICMAVHSGHHVLASVVVSLPFTLLWWAFPAKDAQIADAPGQLIAKHGRAPPLF